jgi:DNA-binding CsgD family transcriptional regulator/PAS domain-containing protein
MHRSDQEHAAVRRFYDAATGQADWGQAFDDLLAATGFDGAAFYAIDSQTRTTLDQRWHRLDTSFAEPYLRDYIAIDPRAAQVFVKQPTRILYDYLHTPEAEIDRDPFYAWFQPSQGMRYYVGGQSGADNDVRMTLTLHRPRRRGHADAAELQTFARLFDHFEHAVNLQRSLVMDARRQEEALARQESEGHGVILLDRNLAVLYANAAARRIAERGDALLLAASGLAALSPDNRRALGRALDAARRHEVGRPVELARCFGGLPYVLTAYPVPSPDLLAARASVAVAVRILDPDAVQDGGLAEAAALLGLTAQETAVAVRLAAGADPIEISAELGLKPATVRTYLASIYRKTGARRQGELVARLLRLSGFLEAAAAITPPS